MQVQVLGSAIDGESGIHFASSYLIGAEIAIDAGSIGLISSIARQRAIRHVFLSHSHADHLAALPMFLDNVYQQSPDCPTLYCGQDVRDVLREHVFNDRVWPDLVRLEEDGEPFLNFRDLTGGQTVAIDDIRITPVELDHVVPTFGFVIEDATATVGIVSDTAPTEEIWRVLRSRKNLKAVFLESAFPNRMAALADKTGHLTPALFQAELRKLGRDVPVIAVHIKPAFHDETADELRALPMANVRIAGANQVFVLD